MIVGTDDTMSSPIIPLSQYTASGGNSGNGSTHSRLVISVSVNPDLSKSDVAEKDLVTLNVENLVSDTPIGTLPADGVD